MDPDSIHNHQRKMSPVGIVGILFLTIGVAFLLWFTFGYFCLALLTRKLLEDVTFSLLIQGFGHALWSWPGMTAIGSTLLGGWMIWVGKNRQKNNQNRGCEKK